jgi:hypothetical protein
VPSLRGQLGRGALGRAERAAAWATPDLWQGPASTLLPSATPASDARARQAAQPSAREATARYVRVARVLDATAQDSVHAAPVWLAESCAANSRDKHRRPTPAALQGWQTRYLS